MSRSTFGDVEFAVIAENGFWPSPEPDSNGIDHYRASVLLTSADDLAALKAMYSLPARMERPLGSLAVVLDIEAGTGADALTVPSEVGGTSIYSAVLVAIKPTFHGRTPGHFRADVDFVIVPS